MSHLICELYGDVLVATFAGPIDRKTSPALGEELLESVAPAEHVVCDLTNVPYISSTGYRLLLHAYHEISAKRGRAALVGASDEIRDTMIATGFRDFFLMSNSLDEALEQVCQESVGHSSLR